MFQKILVIIIQVDWVMLESSGFLLLLGLPLHAALQAHASNRVIASAVLWEAHPDAARARASYPFQLALPSQQHWRRQANNMATLEVAVGKSVMIASSEPHQGLQVGEVSEVLALNYKENPLTGKLDKSGMLASVNVDESSLK